MGKNRQRMTVIKNDHTGQEVWRYPAQVLERKEHSIIVEATFNRGTVDVDYVTFQRGDRFIETFYSDRWYCVFEIYDSKDDQLKGWYCNIGRPALLGEETIEQDDLALDLFVSPECRMGVLDRDEFEALPISEEERQQAETALKKLQAKVRSGESPFICEND